jgi:hypothetical protein
MEESCKKMRVLKGMGSEKQKSEEEERIMFDLLALPRDTLRIVISFVEDPYVRLALAKTCKTLRDMLTENENLYWKQQYLMQWHSKNIPEEFLDQGNWKRNFFERYHKHRWGRSIHCWKKENLISNFRLV